MSPQASAILSMIEQCSNGYFLAAARAYLADHHNQMSADPMYLGGKAAYLYRRDGYVDLHITGRPDDLPVFILDPLKGWRELANLDDKYAEWSHNGK